MKHIQMEETNLEECKRLISIKQASISFKKKKRWPSSIYLNKKGMSRKGGRTIMYIKVCQFSLEYLHYK